MSPGRLCGLSGMTTSTAVLSGISTVAIPVSDQDAAARLYGQLGFPTVFDADLGGGFRWVALAAPDGGCHLSLVAASDVLPAGIDTGIRLTTADARAAHAAVAALGLEVGELLDWETAPLMFSFRDADGNRLYVSESG
jgi:catechol 2,3-dioxygenase-like lactoylglutathione lyase family enzyme